MTKYIKDERSMDTFKKEGRIPKHTKLQGNIKYQAWDKNGKRLRKMSHVILYKRTKWKKTEEGLWKDKHQWIGFIVTKSTRKWKCQRKYYKCTCQCKKLNISTAKNSSCSQLDTHVLSWGKILESHLQDSECQPQSHLSMDLSVQRFKPSLLQRKSFQTVNNISSTSGSEPTAVGHLWTPLMITIRVW